MRYYNVVITNPKNSQTVLSYTTLVNGKTDPGALRCELDILAYGYAQPAGGSYVRFWGVPLQLIAQASNLVGMNITVYAGMQKGLPLANPAQAGIIAQGQVYQAFGNWIGLDETLDIFMLPYVGTIESPANLTIAWRAGQPLSAAIQASLQTAFPKMTVNVNINSKLVLSHDEVGYYNSLSELSAWMKQKTASVIGGSYPGVDVTIKQNQISVYDGTTQTTPKMIAFTDLIGQPTWIDYPTIQLKTVMRGDISVGDYITIPPTIATTTPGSQIGTPFRSKPTFQGSFWVTGPVRHVGDFRQPDAASWCSIINAVPAPAEAS